MQVFVSIVAIEAAILVPSYWRRQRELLSQLEAVSEAAVESIVRLAEQGMSNEAQLLRKLEAIASDPVIRGFALYRLDGTPVGMYGESPAIKFDDIDNLEPGICDRLWDGDRYDVARSISELETPYLLIVRHDASSVQGELYAFIARISGLVLIISIFVTGVTFIVIQRLVITPLLRLRNDLDIAGKALSRGDDRPQFASLDRKEQDELGETIATFAAMFDRVETEIRSRKAAENKLQEKARELETALQDLQQAQLKLIQTEKMSSLGQFVAGVAHEINNPISFVHGNLTSLESYIDDLLLSIETYKEEYPDSNETIDAVMEDIDFDYIVADIPKLLASMKNGTDRVRNIVLALRNFSRLDEADRKFVDITEGLENTLFLLQMQWRSVGIEVVKNYGNLPEVECYPGYLNQVFASILTNAIESLTAKRDRGSEFVPTLTLTTERLENEDAIVVRIADNGTGMTEEVRQKLFDPFFTTKPIGKGTGLGLAVSYQIVVRQHGGELECISTLEEGTEFIIKIPTTL